MDSFQGKLAVITGGGTGMGRALAHRLLAEGCSVAICDVNDDTMAAAAQRGADVAQDGARITTHRCDVSDETQVIRFKDEVVGAHATDHIDLLFNNAGIGGGGSFVAGDRAEWERTFGVCWWGVYYCSRAFLPLLTASDDAYLVNTSSVNGFWASLGPRMPHTAYSTAKFAVKGFSEALIEDLRLSAPHVKVAVVMPGHIGTDIVSNSQRFHVGGGAPDPTAEAIGAAFRDAAPLDAAGAATVILDGVRAGDWRILVGDDAYRLDEAVRADPEGAYDPDVSHLQLFGPGAASTSSAATPERQLTPKEVVARFLRDGFDPASGRWNREVIDECFDVDGYYSHTWGAGLAETGRRMGAFFAAFGTDRERISEDLIAEGDRVVHRVQYRTDVDGELLGISSDATPVLVNHLEMWRVQDGKIVEHWGGIGEAQHLYGQLRDG